ncbi:hypothetical protein AVDCRST_MAG94-671 [uncultured Leptolyngbya sp.]|uniref:Uncharacterized protein n=1 Tax=uncultured Leptolyngbya sp. TaxID=332963 RepID=A0A6J4KH30_9CYAN|nr:hypothetical protein AVDCRST_MAG94-671 [uncultured Leptolyngbya sp.]
MAIACSLVRVASKRLNRSNKRLFASQTASIPRSYAIVPVAILPSTIPGLRNTVRFWAS